jgi:hypothetical protein
MVFVDSSGEANSMSGISAGVIVLVAVLATFCVSALALHLRKGTSGGYLKVKFGPFVFEYGTVAPASGDDGLTPPREAVGRRAEAIPRW